MSDAQSTSDTKAVADPDAEVTSLRLKLEEMTRERDSLVFALDRLQVSVVLKGFISDVTNNEILIS